MNNQPYRKAVHASQRIQNRVGLGEPNCEVPRVGDRTRIGAQGFNLVSCLSHMQPLTGPQALLLWNMIPANAKHFPPNANDAQALSLLAQMAGEAIPRGCAALLPHGQARQEPVTFYHSPGSPIFKTRLHAYYFISFLYLNMDLGHRVKWYDLTGREQFEWYDAFEACGYTHLRNEPNTRGLRGTDLSAITTQDQLAQVVPRSASISRRRPNGHTITQDDWNATVNRLLEFD